MSNQNQANTDSFSVLVFLLVFLLVVLMVLDFDLNGGGVWSALGSIFTQTIGVGNLIPNQSLLGNPLTIIALALVFIGVAVLIAYAIRKGYFTEYRS